jgi:hypothetical protein
MKPRTFTILCIVILITISTYIIFKVLNGDIIESKFISCLLAAGILFTPLLIATLFGLIRRQFFHITVWVLTTIIVGVTLNELYHQFKYPTIEKYSVQNYIVEKYFGRKAPFFSSFSTIITYNEKLDTGNSDEGIIKCMYRVGDKKDPSAYYIAKVQLYQNRVLKVIYNQPFIRDTALAKKEFSRTLKYAHGTLDMFERATSADNSR